MNQTEQNPLIYDEAFLEQAGLLPGRDFGYLPQGADGTMRATVNLMGLLKLADRAAGAQRWDEDTLAEIKHGIRAQWAAEHGETLPAELPPPPAWSPAKGNQLGLHNYVEPSAWLNSRGVTDAARVEQFHSHLEAFLAENDPTGVQAVPLLRDGLVVTYRPVRLLETLHEHGWPIADIEVHHGLIALYAVENPPSLAGFQ